MIWNGYGVSRFNPVVRSVIASPQSVGQKKGLKYAKTRQYIPKPAFRLAPRNNKVSSENPCVKPRRNTNAPRRLPTVVPTPKNVPAAKELGSGSCHNGQIAIALEVVVDPA